MMRHYRKEEKGANHFLIVVYITNDQNLFHTIAFT